MRDYKNLGGYKLICVNLHEGIRYNVRENEQVINKTVYFAVWIDLNGQKEVSGI